MMLAKRIIPCLDVKNGKVVKGINFKNLRDVGHPPDLAKEYEEQGADEVTFLDITASVESRKTMLNIVSETAEKLTVPLCVGGLQRRPRLNLSHIDHAVRLVNFVFFVAKNQTFSQRLPFLLERSAASTKRIVLTPSWAPGKSWALRSRTAAQNSR